MTIRGFKRVGVLAAERPRGKPMNGNRLCATALPEKANRIVTVITATLRSRTTGRDCRRTVALTPFVLTSRRIFQTLIVGGWRSPLAVGPLH